MELVKKLAKQLENVKISRTDLDAAERQLRGHLLDKWEESIDYDLTTGIPQCNFKDYIEFLKTSLGLDDGFCKSLETMAYSDSKEKNMWAVKFETEFESKYGFIAMIKDENQRISGVYAFHKLKFKLADRRIEKRIQKKWWFFPIGTEVSIEHERVKFASNDIINIKETYMKHKALEALKCNGIINAINFQN